MEVEKPKFGTKKWFENYWYHYKWHTIAGAFVLFLLITFVHDLLSREKYDALLAVASQSYVDEAQQAALESIFESYAEDFDGDGQVNVGLNIITYPQVGPNGPVDPQMQMAAQTRFMVEISEGESMILLLDDYTYDFIGEEGYFADLSGLSAAATGNGRKIPLGETVLAADPLTAGLGDKLFLVLRDPGLPVASKNEEAVANYQSQKALLERLLAAG